MSVRQGAAGPVPFRSATTRKPTYAGHSRSAPLSLAHERMGVKVFRDRPVIGRHPGRCQARSLRSGLPSPRDDATGSATAHSTFHISSLITAQRAAPMPSHCHPSALRALRALVLAMNDSPNV